MNLYIALRTGDLIVRDYRGEKGSMEEVYRTLNKASIPLAVRSTV